MVVWFGHIHLYSDNPEQAADFYENMFEAKRKYTQTSEGTLRIAVEIGGVRIVIWQKSELSRVASTSSSIDHFGLFTNDITTLITNLKSYGCKIRDEICEVVPGTKVAYVWGPDNVLVELMEAKPNS